MASRRIIHDELKKLMLQTFRMPPKEAFRRYYNEYIDVTITLAGVALYPACIYLKKAMRPSDEVMHKYHDSYTIVRAKDPG